MKKKNPSYSRIQEFYVKFKFAANEFVTANEPDFVNVEGITPFVKWCVVFICLSFTLSALPAVSQSLSYSTSSFESFRNSNHVSELRLNIYIDRGVTFYSVARCLWCVCVCLFQQSSFPRPPPAMSIYPMWNVNEQVKNCTAGMPNARSPYCWDNLFNTPVKKPQTYKYRSFTIGYCSDAFLARITM